MTEYDGSTWLHTNVFADGQLLATYSATGTPLTFALNDWLGTKRVQAKADGELDTSFLSLPYGDQLATGTGATEHFFTGKVRDSESGNDYFKYRYYSSSVGRWLRPDPSDLQYANPLEPQTLNLYSYVGNAPLTRVDLLGLCWRGFQWACDLGHAIEQAATRFIPSKSHTKVNPKFPTFHMHVNAWGNRSNTSNISLLHKTVCDAFSWLTDAASSSNSTIGIGAGGNAGIGFIVGIAGSGGIQIVADSRGNLGVSITVGGNPGYGVFGVGAMGGVQGTVSTANTIYGLRGGSFDAGVSFGAGPAGTLDGSAAMDGSAYTGTVTVGPGVGTKATALGVDYTWVPSALSTNCH